MSMSLFGQIKKAPTPHIGYDGPGNGSSIVVCLRCGNRDENLLVDCPITDLVYERDGLWHWLDEAYYEQPDVYATREEAQRALDGYCRSLAGEDGSW